MVKPYTNAILIPENKTMVVEKGKFTKSTLSYIFYSFFSHVHTLFGSFLPPTPSPTLSAPRFQAEPVLPLSLILLKRRHKHNKKDIAVLLVEIRIAIQRDS
jgi:hypothetical protein